MACTQACSSDDVPKDDGDSPVADAGQSPTPDAALPPPNETPDASQDASPDAPSAYDCQKGPKLDLARARQLSIEGIRTMLGVTDGFDQGSFWYRDGASDLETCPRKDQSMVAYVADLPAGLRPPGLPEVATTISYEWGLNGVARIVFQPDPAGTTLEAGYWMVSVCAVLKAPEGDADRDEQEALLTQLRDSAEADLTIDYLDQLGIVCWAPAGEDADSIPTPVAYAKSNQLHGIATGSPQVTAVERSTTVYKLPVAFELATQLANEPNEIVPECLRTTSRQLREEISFASLPSLPPPFGPGWQDNSEACPE